MSREHQDPTSGETTGLPVEPEPIGRPTVRLASTLQGQRPRPSRRTVAVASLVVGALAGTLVVGTELARRSSEAAMKPSGVETPLPTGGASPDLPTPAPTASTEPSLPPTAAPTAELTPAPTATPPTLPFAAAWVQVTPMSVPRRGTTATLLVDGRVLVAGGNIEESERFEEIYDPTSDTWSPTAPMATAREGATALRLADGRVLVLGGVGPATSEVFADGAWTAGPILAEARLSASAVLLPDGSVLVTGGYAGPILDSAEIVSVENGESRPTAPMTSRRAWHTATLLPTGRVLVAGGSPGFGDEGPPVATAEIYDPAADTWTAVAPMRQLRMDHSATLLPDGRVLVAGGTTTGGDSLRSVEIYDEATDTWSPGPDMLEGRRWPAAQVFADRWVLMVGGWQSGVPNFSTELFDLENHRWVDGPTLTSHRSRPVLVILDDGSALVVGVGDSEVGEPDAELLSVEPFR